MPNHPKPVSILKLQGTYKKSRHADRVEITAADVAPPVKPSFIKGDAAKEWKRVTDLMAKQKVLHGLNQAVLTQYCIMWEQLCDSQGGGEPLGAAFHTSFRLVCSEPCFTPASQHKMPAPPKDDKPKGFGRL